MDCRSQLRFRVGCDERDGSADESAYLGFVLGMGFGLIPKGANLVIAISQSITQTLRLGCLCQRCPLF